MPVIKLFTKRSDKFLNNYKSKTKKSRHWLKMSGKGAITYIERFKLRWHGNKTHQKVNYNEYEHAFSYERLKDFEEGRLNGIDTEAMRGLIYGYTFTEDYAKGIIPNELRIEYWNEKNKNRRNIRTCQLSLAEYLDQGGLIYEAIMSTGEGTLDNPYCVICEKHEYEFLKSHYSRMKIISRGHLPGNIDWFYCEDKEYDFLETFYFDRSRWFERDCIRKDPETNNSMEKTNQETITLLNGTVLDCYPLHQTEEGLIPSENEKEKEISLFLHNAFRFLHHRDRIMSDSRMFLCPVPIQNGIAYTGTSGFQRPVLGVYLEWWLNCKSALICDENGMKKLVYQIAGSPLSGRNSCGVVDENGKTESESIQPFSSLWPSFMRINSRYDEAKSLYQAYTLKEVVDILEGETLSLIDDMELENIYLRSALYWKAKDLPIKISRLEDTIGLLKFRLFYAYRDDLKAIMEIYEEKKEKKEKREKEIDEESKELYRQLKSGEIDNKQYQKRLTPLKKEKENNIFILREYRRSALEPLFPDLRFTLSDVEEFFKDPRSAGPSESTRG